jgi:hypothetical protein
LADLLLTSIFSSTSLLGDPFIFKILCGLDLSKAAKLYKRDKTQKEKTDRAREQREVNKSWPQDDNRRPGLKDNEV